MSFYELQYLQYLQAVKGRVGVCVPFREPRLVEWGTERCAEHGPGAAQAIGSLRRGRPLSRRSMLVLPKAAAVRYAVNQGGNASETATVAKYASYNRKNFSRNIIAYKNDSYYQKLSLL